MADKAQEAMAEAAASEERAHQSMDDLLDGADELVASAFAGTADDGDPGAEDEAEDEPEAEALDALADDDAEAADEQDEEAGEDDEGEAGQPKKLSRREKMRQSVREELEPEIRAEVAAEVEKKYQPQLQQMQQMLASYETERGEVDFEMRRAANRLELLQSLVAEHNLVDSYQSRLETLELRERAEFAEEKAGITKQQQERQQQTAKQREQQAELVARAMARGAGVDPDDYLHELHKAVKKGGKVSAEQILEQMKKAQTPAARPRRRTPRPLPGGSGGNVGAPAPNISLASFMDGDGEDEKALEALEAHNHAGARA